MARDFFELKILTPVGLALQDRATQVSLPSSEGEIGVLPQHVRYIGLLGTGILEYYSAERNQPVRLVISGGFCNVHEDGLTILADSIATAEKVDRDSYAKRRAELQEQLKDGNTYSREWAAARSELDKIEAIDRLISH